MSAEARHQPDFEAIDQGGNLNVYEAIRESARARALETAIDPNSNALLVRIKTSESYDLALDQIEAWAREWGLDERARKKFVKASFFDDTMRSGPVWSLEPFETTDDNYLSSWIDIIKLGGRAHRVTAPKNPYDYAVHVALDIGGDLQFAIRYRSISELGSDLHDDSISKITHESYVVVCKDSELLRWHSEEMVL